MAKENFTLKVHEFNTVLRYFCVLLGDRRKGNAMVKTNPPTFLEKTPMFFGKPPTFFGKPPTFFETSPTF